jgi:hypothetical protein
MYVLVSWQIDEAIYKSVRTLSCNRTKNQQTATCMHVYTNQTGSSCGITAHTLFIIMLRKTRTVDAVYFHSLRTSNQPDTIHTYSLLLQKDNNNDTSSKWMSKLSANSPIILRAYSSLLHSATAGHTFVLSVSNTSVNTADDRPAWMPWLEWLQCICAIMQ